MEALSVRGAQLSGGQADHVGTTSSGPSPVRSWAARMFGAQGMSHQERNRVAELLTTREGFGGVASAAEAARSLYFHDRIVLTCGPKGAVGALVMGHALTMAGKQVTYVASESAMATIRGGIASLDGQLQNGQNFHVFSAGDDTLPDTAAASTYAEQLIEGADAVVAIGVADPNSKGHMPSRQGVSENEIELPIFEVARAANAQDLLTVSIGSRRNDVGGCNWQEIFTKAPAHYSGGTTPTTFAIRAGEINAGAYAVALVLLKYCRSFAGAIQPKALQSLCEVPDDDTPGRSCADLNLQLAINLMKAVNRHEKVPHNLGNPTDVAVFDSSNGAFIAATVLKAEFNKRGFPFNFIMVVDHDNAPYGQYVDDKEYQMGRNGRREKALFRLVSDGLTAAERASAAMVIMACNTACTVPDAQKSVRIPVVDLILVTAKGIAEDGGVNPCIIATPVTAASDAYPNAVLKASNGTTDLMKDTGEQGKSFMIGAPPWAGRVNKMDHTKPEFEAEIRQMVMDIVVKVPKNATSIWLCCTHYPALQGHIEDALAELGLDIKVINPMKYQAAAAIAAFDQLEKTKHRRVGRDRLQGSDRVLTSGSWETHDDISTSAANLYQDTLVEHGNFGQTNAQTRENIRRQQERDATRGDHHGV